MKKHFFFVLLLLYQLVYSQQITHIQYWFGDDFAGRVLQPVSSNASNQTPLNVAFPDNGTNQIDAYFHCRFVDSNDNWSAIYSHQINNNANASTDLVQVEYWFDTNTNNKTVASINSIIVSNVLDHQELDIPWEENAQKIVYRFKSKYNNWTSIQTFGLENAIYQNNQIESIQYWFGDDFAGRVLAPATLNANGEIDFSIAFPDNGLNELNTYFHCRFVDKIGNWSAIYSQQMQNNSNPALTEVEVEYWFDDAFSNRILTSLTTITNNNTLDHQELDIAWPPNAQTIHYRFKSDFNQWSSIQSTNRDAVENTNNQIVAVEYWLNDDFASRQTLPVSQTGDFYIDARDFNLSTTQSETIYLRYKDQLNRWSSIIPVTNSVVPTDGLVAYYPFNGNANDESNNSNNGTVNGATLTSDRFGNCNKAYLFNGTSDYINISNSTTLESPNSGITLSSWVYVDNLAANGAYYLCKNDLGNYDPYQYRMGIGNDSSMYFGFKNSNSESVDFSQSISLNNQKWNHLLTTYDGSFVKFFINGTLISTQNYSSTISQDSKNLDIGRDAHGPIEYYKGKLDDIRIYNRALSDNEVTNLYLAESINATPESENCCVTWSGSVPTGDKLTAANYLCSYGIIQNNQNGDENAQNTLTRELMAKVTYLSLYKGTTPNSPAIHFPVPFLDMQNSTSQWLNAVKTLAYLEYNDDKTAFDRDFIHFNPTDLVKRKYAVKILLEAFNISPSNATPSPFSDVSTTEAQYGYIKKAHELGLLPAGTLFNYDGNVNMTREDLFVILWKILTSNTINRPTESQLNDKANYFIPGNYRQDTFSKVPDLDQANFNHYQKTSFAIAGRGVSLDFTHTYNSFLTELPKGFFEELDEESTTSPQLFRPLGVGWTHTYNIYAQKVSGYLFGDENQEDKLMVFYPDGSISIFNYNSNQPESSGVYDTMSKTSSFNSEQITITTKSQIKYVLENYNNGKFYFIKSIKDRNNNGVVCDWEEIANLNKYRLKTVREIFTDSSTGRSLTFNYAGTLVSTLENVTDNALNPPRVIHFDVDLNTKNLVSFTDAKGQQTMYNYDNTGNSNTSNLLTEIILPKGNKIKNTYADRKLTQSQTFSAANVVSSTTAINWTPYYNSSGFNSTAEITDSNQRITSYIHNTNGNPAQITSPTQTTNFTSYDSGNNQNLPTGISINGQNSSIDYDAKGNILNISKNGISNSFTYTNLNDVDTHTDGNGNVTNYDYDNNGNLVQINRPTIGGATTISRNSYGQVESVTNPSGIETTFGYDTNGLTNQIVMPLGIETSSVYDNASRLLTTIDANGNTTSFEYDVNDNLKKTTDANNGIVEHAYDANDNHLSIKNPKNETQTNTYNFDDDSLASETFGPHTKSYTYNDDGSLATFTRGNGTFTYTYFPNGRLQSDGQTSYTYDNRGNVKSVTNTNGTLFLNYDTNDRLTSYTDYYNNTVAYTYDNNNNVTSIKYPGNKTVTYEYDAINRCTKVTDWNSKETLFNYMTDDRLSLVTLPNSSFTEYTYDAAGRPIGISNKKADGTVLCDYNFTLDNAGNHLTETINEPTILLGLQNIVEENTSYGSYPFNRISSEGDAVFSHNAAGAITNKSGASFTFDLNDNMLTAPNSSFTYDGAGNRRSKSVNGTTTRYVLSILGMSQVLMETNSSNAAQNYYIYGPTGLLYRIKPDNTYSYYHYDYRGSTTAITNENQAITHSYSYDPFGKVIAKTEADTNPFQYVGKYGVQYESPTLTYMRARYYDPTTGRFVSEDPIWALNLYPYADNNPVMKIDADGNLAGWVVEVAAGATVTAVIDGVIGYREGERGWKLSSTIAFGAIKGGFSGGLSSLVGNGVVAKIVAGTFSSVYSQVLDDIRNNKVSSTSKYTEQILYGAVSGILTYAGGNEKVATKLFGKTGLGKIDMRETKKYLVKILRGTISGITDKFIENIKKQF